MSTASRTSEYPTNWNWQPYSWPSHNIYFLKQGHYTLREKCPYSEYFYSEYIYSEYIFSE